MAVAENAKYRRQAALWTQKAYNNRDKLSRDYRLWLEMWHAYYYTKNTEDVLKYCGLLENSDIKSRQFWHDIGMTYLIFKKPDKAMKIYKKIEKISSEWGEDWEDQSYYYHYSNSCHLLGMHDKEAKILQTGLNLFPEGGDLIWLQARCAVALGDTVQANLLIKKLAKIYNANEAYICGQKAYFYELSGMTEEAEKYFRRALQLDNKNDYRYARLGFFLINSDRNVDEGMDLLNKVQKKNPGEWNYNFYFNKSLGLFKQGKFSSADSLLKILSDSTWTASIEIDNLKKAVRDSLNRKN
jgi:tetratricopeptide (TPR) repeat protein